MARLNATPAKLSVTVCGFEFVFDRRDEAAIYLKWFEDYATRHRRQFAIIDAEPSMRNRLAKLPAHLFKAQNRPKVIKALQEAMSTTAARPAGRGVAAKAAPSPRAPAAQSRKRT